MNKEKIAKSNQPTAPSFTFSWSKDIISYNRVKSTNHQENHRKTGPVSLHCKKQRTAFGTACEALNLTKEFKLRVAPGYGKPHKRITTPPAKDTMKQTENCGVLWKWMNKEEIAKKQPKAPSFTFSWSKDIISNFRVQSNNHQENHKKQVP